MRLRPARAALLLVLALLPALPAANARADVEARPGARAALYAAYLDYALGGDDAALDRAIAVGGETSFLAFEQALQAGRQGDRARMVERSRRAVALDPENGDAQALLARIGFRMVDDEMAGEDTLADAIGHGDASVRLGTADSELFASLAAAHSRLATRADAAGDASAARAHRAAERAALQTWAERLHVDLAWQRLADLARESDDPEAEALALRAQLGGDAPDVLVVQRLADVLRRLGRCESALPELQAASARKDLDRYAAISVSIDLGECAVEVGPAALGEAAFRRALEQDPTNLIAAAGLAESLWLQGKRSEAKASLAGASGSPSAGLDAAARLALLTTRARWELSHDLPEAAEDARKASDLAASAFPRQALATQELVGQAALASGDLAAAESAARAALERDASHEASEMVLVDALWLSGRRSDARAEIAAFEKRVTSSDQWFLRVARWEVSRGLDADAKRHAHRALEGHGVEGADPADVAEVALRAGDAEDAGRLVPAAEARRPGDADVAYLAADVLAARGHRDEAVARLPDPRQDAYALERRAQWESEHRLHDAAREHALAARALIPAGAPPAQRARFDALVGTTLLAAASNEDAIPWLEKAVDTEALVPGARRRALALALSRTHRLPEALAVLDAGLRNDPDNAGLLLEKGRTLIASGDLSGGLQALKAALAPTSFLPAWHAQVALVAADAGAGDAARRMLDTALAAFPNDVTLRQASAHVRDEQGRLDEAEAELRRALELDPGAPSSLNALGYFLAEHGVKLDEAVKLLRKAVDARNDEPAYLDSLGWALRGQGKLDDAEKALSQAIARDRDPVILMHLGTVREAQGRNDDALVLYREALRYGLTEEAPRVVSRVRELEAKSEPHP